MASPNERFISIERPVQHPAKRLTFDANLEACHLYTKIPHSEFRIPYST